MIKRFVLLQLITTHYHQDVALRNMAELEQLVDTFGGEIIEKSVQHRIKPHPDTYIGPGKLDWLKETVKEKKIDVVVLNHIVNSGQLFRLEKALWEVNPYVKVWDRVDLILNIFDQHATTTEAKLQIKLARAEHIGPRIYGLGKTVLSRQGGGSGGGARRGKGETNIEIERRNIKKEKQKIQLQLKKIAKQQEQRIQERKKKGINTVALIGYTSAGKTTLFNALTSKNKTTSKGLFTTLDSVVGKLKLEEYDPTILISDTIGFIDDLPPFLINAFRSTLLESIQSQILLHVIDASDPKYDEKIVIVEKIIRDLDAQQKPILVFNKIDTLTEKQREFIAHRYRDYEHYFVSAKTGAGIDQLKSYISNILLPKRSTTA